MRQRNTLNGKQLAEILPRVLMMRKKGMFYIQIGDILGFSHETIRTWAVNYEKYLNGQPYSHINRAIPYLVVKQARIQYESKATKENKVKSHKSCEAGNVEQKQFLGNKTEVSILWGLFKIVKQA